MTTCISMRSLNKSPFELPPTRPTNGLAKNPAGKPTLTEKGFSAVKPNSYPYSDVAIYAGSNQGDPLGVTAEDCAVQKKNPRCSAMFTLPPPSVSVFKAEG